MYALYSLLTAVGLLLLSPYFLLRGLLQGKYLSNIPERMGFRFPPELGEGPSTVESGKSIWIHAVSVGEVLAVLPLAKQLKDRFPSFRLVVSTTTVTGQQLARERMSFADAIFYFPLDWRGPVRRALAAARPAAVVVVETEIWPNFLRECRRAAVPVIFVNGRLSEHSFRGHQRGIRFSLGALSGFLSNVLGDGTLFLMQSKGDASRLVSLGAAKERVLTTGNLKYDLAVPGESPLSAWLEAELARHGRRPVVVAGSVLANEEGPVLQAFGCVEREFPRALLILAPRKPEQFDNAAAIVVQSGRKLLRRRDLVLNGAGNADFSKPGGVLLLDSIGELAGLYRLADTVFVGGSLVPAGGHNILEPAVFGKAPVYGSSMENFREMAEQFLASGAGVRVKNSDELGNAWTSLLRDPERASRMGGSARQLVDQNRGATQRVLEHIERVIGCRGSREVNRPSGWLRLLWPLSVLYSLAARGKAWCYDRGLFPVRRLPGKVISVGNLTVGGTGKTPMVLAIAERLAREGKQAAILTRGYKGTPDGQPGGVPQSDEVALLRERVAGKVKLGVGPDRYANGMTLSRHGIDCFILDDGFQHLRLARDANIALIDATDPFGGRMVLPAGRLREPVSALGRADLVVITRSVQASSPALEAVLRRHTNSPIFYASTHLENVLRVPRLDIPLPQQDWRKARFLAFCGIGNPAAFFNDLRQWGFQLVRERSFADHHAYTAEEAVELEKAASASSADALLCTEKDVWNLRNVQFRSLPVYCCRISFELPETFWAALSETVRRSGPGDEPR